MTEEEARTKECPQHLIMSAILQASAIKNKASDEIIDKIGNLSYCSASNCMMWKWEAELESVGNGAIGFELSTKEGYCGLSHGK